jgi:hypothetical protein
MTIVTCLNVHPLQVLSYPNVELAINILQMLLDRSWTDIERRRNFLIRKAVAYVLQHDLFSF